MASTRHHVRVPVTLGIVTVIVGINSSGWLPERASVVLDNGAQLAAALVAIGVCAWAARRLTGAERTWRRLMAVGMAGWAAGQVIWSWYQIFSTEHLPSPSLADLGYLSLPPFALMALFAIAASAPRSTPVSRGRDRLVLVLDGLIVVASLAVLSWATVLGPVVDAGADTRLAFAVAIAHPLTGVVLTVIVALLVVTRPVPRTFRPQLFLLGLGLVALAMSDCVYAYLIASGAEQMSSLANTGYIAGPALIALAGAATVDRQRPEPPVPVRHRYDWMHLLVPYVPFIATGPLILARAATGQSLSTLEIYLGWLGLALVVARQMVTLVENTALLARVSDGQQRLVHQAYHDPLTGLANRALFRDRLQQAVERHREHGRPVALLFVDLDDFKLVNDSLGHAAGDRLLRAVGARLLTCVRVEDAVARLGGDEFAVLLEGDAIAPVPVGERIIAALREPFTVDAHVLPVTASVGVVVPDPDEPLTPDSLLRRADAAMYAGKRRGKGLLVRYDAGVSDGNGDPHLPDLLADALAGDPGAAGFEVHYQPIVRFEDAATVAVEALARWSHPAVGAIDPDVFVRLAERSGLVAALDDFVLDRACADAAALTEAYGQAVDVHVNVSAGRLGRPELEAALDRVLAAHALRPGRLVLEITETSRITDLPAAAAAARRIRARGVRVALDDFGSGFNALAQLHALPVDVVKLDAALTDIDTEPDRTEALARSVLAICAELQITVVAEGVETLSRAGALARLGCRLGQGYLYGPPRPLAALTVATG
ncbi:putative bifunctional diguanylate cyclase/phosphodiesterase [Phytohabitans rumicis]|uniref:GGDEF-domain containing protein n=1 Tax=Phytohabitans rumicis TaxID=1076125 RepID=A0A6V8L6C1_9ACTN|nr:EAL domain-containing protein [Phytohabitans rumicis]GFJ92782.1 GGDEF-domain containing protein [Phytohabitans rumicis]